MKRVKGEIFYPDVKSVSRTNMLRTMKRAHRVVQPDRRWFGNTWIVSQQAPRAADHSKERFLYRSVKA
ncbi:hypothetical protein BS47DRAFT_854059 [Hydnum rufescens UP504]|uniref:Uncharacterized protein n=1 Tax=Hydnum rufescens UP504 TaxID=1448309 RepID=A0A9P6B9R9_9AGAM|nr:hypothetical protein BS47DRAFT_854059 [Hydnum rufescens UP504]